MSNTDAESLIDKAKEGKTLSRSERQRAIQYLLLDSGQPLPTGALAQTFGVSERTIRNDRADIEAKLAEEAERQDLIGKLHSITMSEVSAIERRLMKSDLNDKDFLALHRERREAMESYLDRVAAYRLEREVRETRELLERTNGNGHATAPSSN